MAPGIRAERSGQRGEGSVAISSASARMLSSEANNSRLKYRVYDFRRPEKLSKEQVRHLRVYFGRFGRGVTNYLTSLSRTSVDLTLVEVDQTSYGQVFRPQSIPALLCPFAVDDNSQGMLKLSLHQLFVLIDRLMGGEGSGTVPIRPLTAFERSVASDIAQKILDLYAEVLAAPKGHYVLEMLDTDERVLPRTQASDEFMVKASYSLRIGSTCGQLIVYTPLGALSAVIGQMHRETIVSHEVDDERSVPQVLCSLPLEVTVELGTLFLTAGEIAELAPGDVLPLDKSESDPVRVLVGGVCRFKGRPGISGRKLAVVIEGVWKETDV